MSIAIYLLLLYSFLAMLFDLTTNRIPNYLVAAELVGGLIFQLYIFGPMGILSFLGGIAVPFILSYALFLFRMIGAGDIKLFMALGAVAGFPLNVRIMLWSVICGGIISVCIMWRRTGFMPRLSYLISYVRDFIRTGVRKPYRKEGGGAENFHFTVAIFASVLVLALTRT
jgi:prepilin peptidase CpaA